MERTHMVVWLVLTLLWGCTGASDVRVPTNDAPFIKLSQYNFFRGELKQLEPNARVLPYEVITPLFSDYAEKARFVWMPRDQSGTIVDQDETFHFPTGAVLIKNFYYPEDFRAPEKGRRLLETRLLVKKERTWDALTYIWNDEQTEAFLEITGDIKPVSWIDREGQIISTRFVIPNKNQCKGCHEYKKELQPIGPKIRHLNTFYQYDEGAMNQLEKWAEVGYLEDLPMPSEQLPRVAAWDDERALLSDRALAYLEVNCGVCHDQNGPANISGLYFTTLRTDSEHLGICKSPVSAGSGSGGRSYDIVPGQPEASILVYRMESLNPGEMMPELGRTLVHQEGLDLIREWIRSLPGTCPESL